MRADRTQICTQPCSQTCTRHFRPVWTAFAALAVALAAGCGAAAATSTSDAQSGDANTALTGTADAIDGAEGLTGGADLDSGDPTDAPDVAAGWTDAQEEADLGPQGPPQGCAPDLIPPWATIPAPTKKDGNGGGPNGAGQAMPGDDCALPGWPSLPQSTPMVWTEGTQATGLGDVGKIDACLAWYDVNADGLEDLVTIRQPLTFSGPRTLVIGFGTVEGTIDVQTFPMDIFMWPQDCSAADLDADGHPELLIAGSQGLTIVALSGPARGKAVTSQFLSEAIPAQSLNPTYTLATLDFDSDGALDVYLATQVNGNLTPQTVHCGDGDGPYAICCMSNGDNSCMTSKNGTAEVAGCCQIAPQTAVHVLLRNNKGKLEPVADSIQLATGVGQTVTVRDINRDGLPDWFVGTDFGPHGWYLNGGDAVYFRGGDVGMRPYANMMGSLAADFDLDHHDDVLVANWGASIYYQGGPTGYTDQSAKWNVWPLTKAGVCWGEVAADLNNDGWLDVVTTMSALGSGGSVTAIGGGNGDAGAMQLGYHAIFHNVGGTFEGQKLDWPSGAEPTISGTVSVAADVDHDGDLDLLLHTPPGLLSVWLNQAPADNHWLEVRVTGQGRPVVGALVQVWAQGHVLERVIELSSGYGAHIAPSARFGLGSVKDVDLVRIWWPSGQVTEIKAPTVDQVMQAPEPKGMGQQFPGP